MKKIEIRKSIIERRNDLSIKIKEEYDILIFNKLIENELYKRAKKIFVYISFGSEVDTKKFIEFALKDNKIIYVPKTDKIRKEMKAVRIYSLDNMIIDKWGILEPKYADKNDVGENFDLIIMPGVAFDKRGNRIGYGGGYYDKYISALNYSCNKLALAYDFQIIKNINSEEHDIKIDNIITNIRLIKF